MVIGLLAALLVSFEFATIFQCTPVSYNWRSVIDRTAQGSCTDRQAQVYTAAAFNIIFDILVLLLPVPSLLKLNTSWMKKLGVGIVFLVGILVTICSLVRISYLSPYGNSANITWDYAYISIWSLLEVHLTVVCVCVPAAAGLFYRTWRHVKHGSPAESLDDLDVRRNAGDEKQMLGDNADTMPPRTVQTTAQVSGLGLSHVDLESGASAKSDDTSSSPPRFDETWTNLSDKDKQRPAYELHGNSKDSHETSTSRPVLVSQKKSSESRPSSSKNRPALPSQSQSNESHVLGNDLPILLSSSESKERQEKYRAFHTKPDARESQFRPAMQSPGSSEESMDRSTPLSPASPQQDDNRPDTQSSGASKDGQERPALQSKRASKDSQQRPSLHSRVQSRDSQGRPSPLSPGQLDETMVAGTARPSFYEYRPSNDFQYAEHDRLDLQSNEQSLWDQSMESERPNLYTFGQSQDGQSMYSGRPGLFSPASKDCQSFYSDRPVLHGSQSNDGSMTYRPSFDSRGCSRDNQVYQAHPAFYAQDASSSTQWQSIMSSRGHSRDGSTTRPALFSQYQSKDSQGRYPFRSSMQSKSTGTTDMERPAICSAGVSRQSLNREEIEDNMAAASAMVGVSALEKQDQDQPPPPAKSPARHSYTKSPQAHSPGVEKHDQNADLAATIADALVGVRQMQNQLTTNNEEPEPESPSKSSQDTRKDSATETSEKPIASPWSFNGRSKSYRDQANETSPVGSPPLGPPLFQVGSPSSMAGRDHPLRSQGRQPSYEGEQLRQRAATIESEARERPLDPMQSPKTPKTPKLFETRANEEERRRLDAEEVAAPEAVTAAATVAATATVPAVATAALGEKLELARRSRSDSELIDDDEDRKRAEAWRPVTLSISRSVSHEEHPLSSAPTNNPYEDEQFRKGAGTQTDFPYESEENLNEPEQRMSPELQHYKRQRAAESEAALADAYYEHMERKNSPQEPRGQYDEEYRATRRAERAARRAASAAESTTSRDSNHDIGNMLSAMASAVGEVGDQPAKEDRNREAMDEVARPEAMDEHPLQGLRASEPIENELEAQQATELAIADAAPPPTIHRSRSNSRSSRPDPSPIQRRSHPPHYDHDFYELDGSAPPPTTHRSRSNSSSNKHCSYKPHRLGADSGAESATENDHPLRSQGKSGLYSHPNSRPTSFTYRRRTTQSDSAAESAGEDDHPLRSQGRSGLYSSNNRQDSTESLDAAQTRNASVVAIKAAAEQRRARQKRRTSGHSVQSAKSDSSTEILYEGRANAKKEKTYKSFVTEPAKPLGRGASPRGFPGAGRGDGEYSTNNSWKQGYQRDPSPMMRSSSDEYRVQVTNRPGSGGSRELRMPWREWDGDDEAW